MQSSARVGQAEPAGEFVAGCHCLSWMKTTNQSTRTVKMAFAHFLILAFGLNQDKPLGPSFFLFPPSCPRAVIPSQQTRLGFGIVDSAQMDVKGLIPQMQSGKWSDLDGFLGSGGLPDVMGVYRTTASIGHSGTSTTFSVLVFCCVPHPSGSCRLSTWHMLHSRCSLHRNGKVGRVRSGR